MNIRPIKTERDYQLGLKRIEQLMDATPDSAEGDELEVLSTLIESFEDRHFAIGEPDPIAAIKFRMDQLELTRKDLEPYIGSRHKVSEVLNGKRDLSLNMIRRLHTGLKIPLENLIGTTA